MLNIDNEKTGMEMAHRIYYLHKENTEYCAGMIEMFVKEAQNDATCYPADVYRIAAKKLTQLIS